ncbi:hypothetical protein COCMIDRAFT_23433 [Bipolaris oryzae ATCC 44560]|uniref:Uncharacterized protein n=1 Tax=Bipolaris oryzae ATCC 44560 TaxID=930090 RepID=W6ZG57_COCMI|nr:uncharacterized protein COCMIDRAFT_23433 [Bipolaris oryzae ATCC 44560]EUC48868.1 hypothetical protein COCMIDRAFT_23433 [Bipolaris oryzae ATCC 44560]
MWPAKSHEGRLTSLTKGREEKTVCFSPGTLRAPASSSILGMHLISRAGTQARAVCVSSRNCQTDQSVSASASASANASCPTHSRSSNNLVSMSVRCQAGVNTCLGPSVSMHTHPPPPSSPPPAAAAAAAVDSSLPQVNTRPRINSR